MCNIYKNNLIILSELNDFQLLYYDDDNQLKPDDRYLSYFRPGTKEIKIGFIIKNSFLQIFNCYIVNLVSQENQKNETSETKLIEIENKKHLLRKSLEGLDKYIISLQKHQHNFQIMCDIKEELNNIFNRIEEYKLEYLFKIGTPDENKSQSKGWLYKIYEATVKSTSKNELPEIESDSEEDEDIIETALQEELNSKTEENEPIVEESESIEHNDDTEEPQLGDYFPEDFGEDTNGFYVKGIIYIISRKLFNIFITIGKHINFFF